MTMQTPDFLRFNNDTYFVVPRFDAKKALNEAGIAIDLIEITSVSTANRQGYELIWELKGGDLYLVGLQHLADIGWQDIEVKIEDACSKASGPIFADWFSGKIKVACGDFVRIAMGFASAWEFEHELRVKNGRLKSAKSYRVFCDDDNVGPGVDFKDWGIGREEIACPFAV